MPHYKAVVAFKARNADFSDTIHITLKANNAIQAKALLQDQYGEKSVQSVRRVDVGTVSKSTTDQPRDTLSCCVEL